MAEEQEIASMHFWGMEHQGKSNELLPASSKAAVKSVGAPKDTGVGSHEGKISSWDGGSILRA